MNNITRGDFGGAAQKKQKKRTSIKILCVIAILFVAFMSPLFNVRNIQVKGNSRLDAAYVIDASGIKKGRHLAFIPFSNAKEKLEKTTYISSAEIKYKFPNTIIINIDEKMPIVYYAFADGYAGINADGYVTDIIQVIDEPLPVAEGITLSSYKIGEKPDLGKTSPEQIDCLIEVAQELMLTGISADISKINVRSVNNILLQSTGGITIKCGDSSELKYKFSILKEVLAKADCSGIVDLSIPGQATYEMT